MQPLRASEEMVSQKEGIEALAIHFDRVSREPNFRTLQQVVTQDAEVTLRKDMAILPVRDLGKVGAITDLSPTIFHCLPLTCSECSLR